jgi:hypothetical protein
MGGRPAMASIAVEGEVRKAPVIQIAACCCMVLRDLMRYLMRALVWNHRRNPYVARERTHAR